MEADCHWIADHLRAADRKELEALGQEPHAALVSGFNLSATCLTATRDGEPCAIFGVVPASPLGVSVGVIWMLGTDRLLEWRRLFLRISPEWLKVLARGFDVLTNRVDSRNKVHIRWLKWLGFRFLAVVPGGPNNLPFLEFVKLT